MRCVLCYIWWNNALYKCLCVGQTYIACDWNERTKQDCYSSSAAEVYCICVHMSCVCTMSDLLHTSPLLE